MLPEYLLLTKMSAINAKKYPLKSETLPFVLFTLPENEAISFCYGLCDVTLIQLGTSITSNLAHVIG
jgi:hypothetical protein